MGGSQEDDITYRSIATGPYLPYGPYQQERLPN